MHAWAILINTLHSSWLVGLLDFFLKIERKATMNNDNLMKRIPLIYRLKASSVDRTAVVCDVSAFFPLFFMVDFDSKWKSVRQENGTTRKMLSVDESGPTLMIKRTLSSREAHYLMAMNALEHR